MINKKLLFLILAIFISFGFSLYSAEEIKAVKGILDLRNVNLEKEGNVKLNGEWEFVYKQFLSPIEISTAKTIFVNVPENISNYEIDGKKLDTFSYATYHLKVLVNDTSKTYGIRIFYILSAYKMFIDGREVTANGKVADSYEKEETKFQYETIFIEPKSNVIDIVIQTSNHTYRKGGLEDYMLFGTKQNIEKNYLFTILPEMIILGTLLIMGFYHLGIFAVTKHSKDMLYFGLFCLVIGFRVFAMGDSAKLYFLLGLDENMRTRTEYLTFFIGVPLFTLFINTIFPKSKNKILSNLFLIISGGYIIAFTIFPVRNTNVFLPAYQLFGIIIIFYILYIISKEVIGKSKGSLLVLSGCIILAIGTIHDMIYVDGRSFFHFTFLLFVFIQSIMLSQKFSYAMVEYEVEKSNLESSQKLISFVNVFTTGMTKQDIITELVEWLRKVENIDDVSGNIIEDELCISCETSDGKIQNFIKENREKLLPEMSKGSQVILKYNENKSYLLTPIMYNSNLFGFIRVGVNNYSNNEDVKRILMSYAVQTGSVIENANLFRKLNEQTKNNTLMRLSGAIVHELKTPLVSIKGLADLILRKFSDNEKLKSYMNVIIKESDRVNLLAEGLLEYFDDSSQTYVFEMLDVTEVYEYIEKQFKIDFESNNIKVEFSNVISCFIYADREHFFKMVFQIIKNSIEAIDINKEERIINIQFITKGIKWYFEIYDNGVGISKSIIGEIFKPLVTTKIQGTGIGLSIVKSIADKQNFFVTVDSEEGKYTNVKISNFSEI